MDDQQIRHEFDTLRKEMREELREDLAMIRKEISDALAQERAVAKEDRHAIRNWLQEHVAGQVIVMQTKQDAIHAIVAKHDESLYGADIGVCNRLTIVEQVTSTIAKALDTSRANWWQIATLVVASTAFLSWLADKVWK